MLAARVRAVQKVRLLFVLARVTLNFAELLIMGSLGTESVPTHLSASLPISSLPIIYVNGRRRELDDGLAETTLLEYLRGMWTPVDRR